MSARDPLGDLLSLVPLFDGDDEATIRARWNEWANQGISAQQVDEWIDVREGGHFHTLTQPGVQEFARLYDLAGTEVVAAGIPLLAFGLYLDRHAATVGLARLGGTPADGEVTFTGPAATAIPLGTTVAGEPADPDGTAPEYQVTTAGVIGAALGTVTLPVKATATGIEANQAPGAVTVMISPLGGVTVSNAAAMVGGTGPETDAELLGRVLDAYAAPSGGGNVADYARWTRAHPGVRLVHVLALWDGPGTVKVVPLDAASRPVSAVVVSAVQADLDPVAGQGLGRAPVGAAVTVQTATLLTVAVAASVELEVGYTLDGGTGTIAVRLALVAAIDEYLRTVPPGGEIVRAAIAARLALTPGVHDVANITLNTAAANITLAVSPAQVAQLGTVTLTAGAL